MLTEKEIEEYTIKILKLYASIEMDLMLDITKRLQIDEPLGGTAAWHTKKVGEVRQLQKEAVQTLNKYNKQLTKETYDLFNVLPIISVEDDEADYLKGVKAGKLSAAPTVIASSKGINAITKRATKDANKLINLVNTTALEFNKQEYLDIINKAFLEVDSGIYSYQTSIRRSTLKLADKGIIAQTYKRDDGTILHYNIDAAVRRSVITSSLQTARDCQEVRAKEYEADLYEVTSHVGARPLCAKDQGRIYSRSGKSKKYRSKASTSEGEPAGLFGINCRHQWYPFIEGINKPSYDRPNAELNEKTYIESQQQRNLENQVKKEKRRLMLSDNEGDKEQFKRSSVKLKQKESKLKTFMEDTGRTQTPRTQVAGFDRSISQRAVNVAKKAN